jgi:hypothetical protein
VGEFGGPGPKPPSWRALLQAREQLTGAVHRKIGMLVGVAGPDQAWNLREGILARGVAVAGGDGAEVTNLGHSGERSRS